MTISMYKASVPIFVQFLTSLSGRASPCPHCQTLLRLRPTGEMSQEEFTRFLTDRLPRARRPYGGGVDPSDLRRLEASARNVGRRRRRQYDAAWPT